jgi:hypothetical protein
MPFRLALYKGTRPGLPGIYNRLVRWWTRSPYSHCELVFSDGIAASSSFADGGVRFKWIEFEPEHWDFIALPAEREEAAYAWFNAHRGQKYDLMGNLQFIIARIPSDGRKWFCSEAVAAALGISDPWRFDPATLGVVLGMNKSTPVVA